MEPTKLASAISELKSSVDAVIVAHNYQKPEVQDIADFVSDSLAMAQYAASTKARVILVAGVRFMAETAKILAPDKVVLVPDLEAGCPLADSISPSQIAELRNMHPEAALVSYVNTSAQVKAVSDICCTSSNALKVVASLPQQEVIFVPDRNLGAYVAAQVPDKHIILWQGFCPTHHLVRPQEIAQIRALHPEAQVLVHAECAPEVQAMADFVGSTSQIIGFVLNSHATEFIIGTEEGVLHALSKSCPEKRFFLVSAKMLCPNMKKNTLEKIYEALLRLKPQIILPDDVIERAGLALRSMLKVSTQVS